MSKTLIIAEKPSVAREIAPLVGAQGRRAGYLEGPDHLVSWAVGHLVGIAEPEEQDEAWAGRWTLEQLPMLPPRFQLRVLPETADQFAVLQRLLLDDRVTGIVNATDAGREGELIFRRIYLVAGCDKPVRRLWASDMTEEGLRKSLARLLPDEEKRNLGLAAFARAEADWLVGMNFSRLFTVKSGGLVSVGRVQTPVLCLLADRRRDIEHFTPQDFWTVEATFDKNLDAGTSTGTRPMTSPAARSTVPCLAESGPATGDAPPAPDGDRTTQSEAQTDEGTKPDAQADALSDASSAAPATSAPDTPVASDVPDAEIAAPEAAANDDRFRGVWHRPPDRRETRVDSGEEADAIATACTGKLGIVESVQGRAGTQQPPLPFDLTTLQREANTRFGYSAKDTLTHAQSLYETRKLITYPRTDSRHLTKELFGEILNHLRAVHHLYPEETMLAVGRIKSGKARFACVDDRKVTDHHAIIPTARKGNLTQLSAPERNIYDMVCRRTIAAFCPEAKFSTSTVTVMVGEHPFIAKGKVFKDKGWMVVEPWRTAEDTPLPQLRKGSKLLTLDVGPVKRQTKAPAHFTDASLLAAMETAGRLVEDDALRQAMKERGLGTPATRAQVIETLVARGYVAKQGKKLVATDRGMQVAETVTTLLPDVASPELTGQWEKRLKDIEAGVDSYPAFMRSIRESVWHGVHRIRNRDIRPLLRDIAARNSRPPDGRCPLCGGDVVETPRGFACKGDSKGKTEGDSTAARCPFIIWKEMHGKAMDEDIVRELLAKGRTAEAFDLTSRQGKSFRAHLVLEGGRVGLDFVRDRTPFRRDEDPQRTVHATGARPAAVPDVDTTSDAHPGADDASAPLTESSHAEGG
ncbi:type IA DNA topoisomerase [Nitratidesulfovibrio vulgaris]|uniref:DNA topoisomerase n=1 Tax=Nitratidesulfovibrio vulgaris (strain DP4) TaxID=391774 RepID=A0A0H3A670_NITV4|nr:type IA DNA topoisomerase [Nitratidesulfovibrio vulgaris]ABM27964.1 DNA topoisomerase III [Nitratidesulfovibrio vulgaris DP4]GEB80542.1 DNA topoisomerase III [Desulfovibrio desulfuricans]